MSSEEETKEAVKQTPEQAAKLLAEAAKTADENRRAEELHRVNLQKAEAEARVAVANAAKGEIEVESNRISLVQQQRQEEAVLATDLFHRTYHFKDEVGARSVEACIDRLAYWHRTDEARREQEFARTGIRPEPCSISIIFSSPGGSVFSGLELYDYIQQIKREGHHVETNTLGMAASMAGILLQAGTTRAMAKEAWVLIHEISTLAWGSATTIEDEVKFLKRIQDRVRDIFMEGVERAKAAGTASTPMTKTKFNDGWKRKDWWLSSDECLKYGFVDVVR